MTRHTDQATSSPSQRRLSDEALVFFEWLARFNNADDAAFEDQTEQVVLRSIERLLEKT